jgi:anti-sigma regulatory factor (Ser/Thr protein kinase)
MGDVTSHTERLDLAPDARSVRAARSFVAGVLARWGLEELADTATLLTSELATNAVRHASSPYAVVVTRTLDGVDVDVLDEDDGVPQERDHDLEADSGRGLQLVSSLARSWGPTPAAGLHGYTKGVRFTLIVAAAGAGTSNRGQGAPSAAR